MFKDPDLFELDQATRQAIYRAAQADLDHDHNLSWRDSILNHAEREFKSRLGGYISHLEYKSEQDSATVLGQAQRIASLLDQVNELVKEHNTLNVKEIRRVLGCVKSSVDAGIRVTDGWRILESLLASAPQEQATDHFVQKVPDKCDRIVWRGKYIHLDNC